MADMALTKENKVREVLLVSAALIVFVLIIGWPQVSFMFQRLFFGGPSVEFPKFYGLAGGVTKVESGEIFF